MDMKFTYYLKVISRLFVILFLLREICVLPLLNTRIAGGFLWWKSLKGLGDTSLGSAILVGLLTRYLEDLSDPDMKDDLEDENV